MAEILGEMKRRCGDLVVVDAPNQTALLCRGGGGQILYSRDAQDSTKPGLDAQAVIDLATQLGAKIIKTDTAIPAHDAEAGHDMAEEAYTTYASKSRVASKTPQACAGNPTRGWSRPGRP
jgi:hypothetical protein